MVDETKSDAKGKSRKKSVLTALTSATGLAVIGWLFSISGFNLKEDVLEPIVGVFQPQSQPSTAGRPTPSETPPPTSSQPTPSETPPATASQPPPSGTSTAAPLVPEITETSASPSVPSPLQPPSPSTVPVVPIVAALQQFRVTVGLETTTYGKEVGPNQYQFANGWGKIQIGFGWSGIRSDGTELSGPHCQILASIEGPQAVPATRYRECTVATGTMFKNTDNRLQLNTPGTYTVKIVDELTKASGTTTFIVRPE